MIKDQTMLTSVNNPWNPFKEWKRWYLFEMTEGYDACGMLARVERNSDEFTEEENHAEHERAIAAILASDFTNSYKKVKESDFDTARTGQSAPKTDPQNTHRGVS